MLTIFPKSYTQGNKFSKDTNGIFNHSALILQHGNTGYQGPQSSKMERKTWTPCLHLIEPDIYKAITNACGMWE